MALSKTGTGLSFAAALSTQADTAAAVREVCDSATAGLAAPADLAIFFVSHQHRASFATLAARICECVGTENLIGCTGESIVGGEREVENEPALALWLARLPDVSIQPMHLEYERTPEGGSIVGWPDDLPDEWPKNSALIAFGDPFSFAPEALLDRINREHPGVPIVGGMASGAMEPGKTRLFLGRRELSEGAVAALIHGAVRIRSVVSQGCRPIGQHYVITRSNRNVIQELGGRPALEQLQELFQSLSPQEQRLVQGGLHVGRVINEYQDHFDRGDFLVRNVIGADPGSGAIAIGELVRPGQTVQFHVRDAQSADEDLRQLIAAAHSQDGSSPLGALLFTCNGRGTRLFAAPNHDAGVLRESFGSLPTAGFFAQGELGPIGGTNFIHGFTASIALFEAEHV